MKRTTIPNSSVCLVSGGACTSVGMTLPASAAAVRAGIASFTDHPFMVDSVGKPMVVAQARFLSNDLVGLERYLELATMAGDEALLPISSFAGNIRPFPLIMGFPLARPGLQETMAKELSTRLHQHLLSRYPISGVEVVPRGHAAGLLALDTARHRLQSGAAALCLIGGVDSYIEPQTLEWLEECDQLHSAGPMNNAWGFIPGEAAGFSLLASESVREQLGLVPLAIILNVAVAHEQHVIKTDTVCLGHGLTQAFEGAFRVLSSPADKIDNVICDMNGEPYRAEEYGFATIRTEHRFVNSSNFHAPADCWGDVGAASGPLFLNLSAVGHRKGYLKGEHTLVWTSSENGERAAVIVGF